MHVRVLLPEDPCNRSPGFRALVIQEETPSPLPVGFPTDNITELTRQQSVMISPGYLLILPLPATGGPALPRRPFCLGVSDQSHVETPLPEVHPPRYTGLDILGPTDAQRLCEDDVDKYEGSLGIPTLSENLSPFRGQYFREEAPDCSRGRVISDC